MAQLGQDFVSHMSAFKALIDIQDRPHLTIWSKVRGPVAKRRNYKDDWILVDVLDYVEEVSEEFSFDTWTMVLASQDDLAMDLTRIGELGVFQFADDYRPEMPQHMVEERLFQYLEQLDRKPDWHAEPVWHEMFMDIYKQYEFYREQALRNSIFFYYWLRDCDLCESEGVQVFRDWFEAAEWIHGFGESAEGPQHLEQVAYEYWQTFNPVPKRDRALEQFEEYGYGS